MLLMAVLQHCPNGDGLRSVDAPRAAQPWMLDPGRENPGSLRGESPRPGRERIALNAEDTGTRNTTSTEGRTA
ncbi:hypothetical protein [Streptomyces sp. NPDC046727]|uniref:hypothetical protein n=1 Tax=Streptomyces sp. NPDC046727 TaxID=3155373 RepID=UPI0033D6BC67